MATLTTWTPDGSEKEEACPVLDDPEPDCYCLTLSSLDIPKAVQYCLRDFRQCPIYKRYMGIPYEREKEAACPVLDDPQPDCYCLTVSNYDVPRAIQYCLGDFKLCPIYLRHVGAAKY